MALITTANKQGIRFTDEEVDLIIDILKEGKTKKEQDQINHTIQMVRSLLH